MPSLTVGHAQVEVTPRLLDLREAVSSAIPIIDASDGTMPPEFVEELGSYANEVANLWGEAAVQDISTKFGSEIGQVGRVAILMQTGSITQTCAMTESSEVTKLIDSSPVLTRRERIVRKLRGCFRASPEVIQNIEGTAFGIFDEELTKVPLGTIVTPEDIRPVVKRTARKFITQKVLFLDEKQPLES